jgi:hypothetical protein
MNATKATDPKDVKQFTVLVVYNGITKEITTNRNQAVKALLEHSLNEFGIQQNRHIQSLYTEAGVELDDNVSITKAGIEPGAHLLLRPSAVKGGC